MNNSSNKFLREIMDRYTERIDRDHDRRRAALLASLPDSPDEPSTLRIRLRRRFFGRGRSIGRQLLKLAAVIVVCAGIGLLFRWSPESTKAEASFADVLRRLRQAWTVRYSSTLELGDAPARTSQIVARSPGLERKTMPEGQQQISDLNRGTIIYIDPLHKWTLTLEFHGMRDIPQNDFLNRLANLPNDAGRSLREETLQGKPVHVFEVIDKGDLITIWADSYTHLPVKIRIVSRPTGDRHLNDEIGAVLTLDDFIWNEPLDDSIFRPEIPGDYEQYHIRQIDDSLPVSENDLIEALRILTDLSEGVFPDSLYTKDLKPIFGKLRQPAAAVIDTGGGEKLLAGLPESVRPGVAPPMVRYFRALRDKKQISRGLQFVNQLIDEKKSWRYLGKGVRRGQRNVVFRYRPDRSSKTLRIILGDLSVHSYTPKPRPQKE